MVRLLGDALHAGKLGESFWLLFSGYVCLNVHYLSVFFLALAASLWIFSLACWLLERNPWLPHTLFYASVQPSTQICQWPFICWMRCASACGHWPQVSMLGDEYGHLRQVSPDSCSSHRSPQMWFHTYQACVLPISGCSVQVNRVMTYHDLDKDLMKFAAFQTLVSGCCCGVTSATSSPSVPLHPQQWYSAA